MQGAAVVVAATSNAGSMYASTSQVPVDLYVSSTACIHCMKGDVSFLFVIAAGCVQDHGAHARGVALPYGKQGLLVTVDSNDPRKATKEAVSVLEEVCSLQAVEPARLRRICLAYEDLYCTSV